ncbi:mitochondrial glycerol-3-phosphate dehydrogenase [Sporothrix bragantina]|uniref:Glycerol-3-phosphate dehydrogenase n=1 Tax=Sporothrix bragantina TaxID=671064 RepID=A0ABP0BZJ9_9PEZI
MAWRSQIRRPLLVSAAAVAAVATGGTVYMATQSRSPRINMPIVPVQRDSQGQIQPPTTLQNAKSRTEQLADLRRSSSTSSTDSSSSSSQLANSSSSSSSEYDLLIIGGGATGTGIALDAATRGLKVALVERDDFSAGTSSKSTKLVHGGVRYLEKAVWNLDYGQLELVMEALGERKTFLEIAPHLSSQLPILLPLQHWWQVPYFWAGTKAYDLLSGSQGLDGSYWMGKSKATKQFPMLNADKLVGGLVYYDGQQNDARTNVSLALTAMLYGATIVNHVEVTSLEKDASGRIIGARMHDTLNEEDEGFVVRAKGVINATGPFSDSIERLDNPSKASMIAPSSGAHIILPGNICPNGMGLLDASTSDGRVVFVLPWEGRTLAGTTDNPCAIERQPEATKDDVDFILKEVSKLIAPTQSLSHKDILATWSGIRPLVKNPNSKNTESLVRSHLVTVSPSGLLTCAGGKWTTYRQMAQDAVDDAIRAFHLTPASGVALPAVGATTTTVTPTVTTGACITKSVPLIGAHGYSPNLPAQITEAYPTVDPDIAQHLASNYGDRAWTILSESASPSRLLPSWPITEAEIRYGVHAESACTAVDVLARRTRLAFVDVNAANEALPRVIAILGDELKWSEAQREQQRVESQAFLKSMGLEQVRANANQAVTEQQTVRKPASAATPVEWDVEKKTML